MFVAAPDTLSLSSMKAALKRNSTQLTLLAKKYTPCDVCGMPENQFLVEKIKNLIISSHETIDLLSIPLSDADKKIDRTFYLALHTAASESLAESQEEFSGLLETFINTFPTQARGEVTLITKSLKQNYLDTASIVQDLMLAQKNRVAPQKHKRHWFSRH